MKGQDDGVDAEERVPTQDFYVPVLEIEGLVRSYSRGLDGKFFIRGISIRGAGGRLVIESIHDGEVGQSADADG